MSQIKRMIRIFASYKTIIRLNTCRKIMPQPLDKFCKWLTPNDHETILGIQMCNLCNDVLSWNEMIKKIKRPYFSGLQNIQQCMVKFVLQRVM
jgi:hypothetical protein